MNEATISIYGGNTVGVERANLKDISALVRMRLGYLCEDYGGLDDHVVRAIENDLPDYFQAHLDRDLFVFVVREEGSIVSCAFLLVVEKPMSPAFINGKTGIVLNVYTCPPYRKRGYARRIMQSLLADAKDRRLSNIELKSTDAGYTLYRSVGFADDGSKYKLMKWKNHDIQ